MQFHSQAGNITNDMKVKIYFTLPEFSMIWEFHIDEPAKGIFDITLGRDI